MTKRYDFYETANHKMPYSIGERRDFSPEQIMIARTIVETYRKMGYTRNDFIKELDGNQLDFDYRGLYIDIWDYKL